MPANEILESNSLPPDENIGPLLVEVLTTTLIIALFLFTARIATRIRLLRLWWDDYVLCLAVTFAIAGHGTFVASIKHGFGRHIFYLKPNDAIFVGQLGLITPLFWLWSTTLVRVSMALMLRRLKPDSDKWWKWGLSAMVGVQVVCAVTATIIDLVQCTPIQANWLPSLPGARGLARDRCTPNAAPYRRRRCEGAGA